MNSFCLKVIGAGVLIRLLGIFRPLLGNFGIYQVGQAMMAKHMLASHFASWLTPQVSMLVNGKPGLVLVFYPASSLLAALPAWVSGGHLDFWGRFQAVCFFAATALVLYRFVSNLLGEKPAKISLVIFSLFPLTLIYGQSFQNAMFTTFFCIFFFDQLYRYFQHGRFLHAGMAVTSISMVLITRPNSVYLVLPAIYLAWICKATRRDKMTAVFQLGGILLLGAILPLLWYYRCWILTHAQPDHIYTTLFSQLTSPESFLSPLVFSLRFYRDLADALAGMILTPLGFAFFLLGGYLALRGPAVERFFLLWAACFMLSGLLIPRKLLDHEFYFLQFLLPASVLIALALELLQSSLKSKKAYGKSLLVSVIILAAGMSLRYSLNPAFVTPKEESRLLELAHRVQNTTSREADRIIVQGTYTLLYYADRLGWGIVLDPERAAQIERENPARAPMALLRHHIEQEGATHFVVTRPELFRRNPEAVKFIEDRFTLRYWDDRIGGIYELSDSHGAHA